MARNERLIAAATRAGYENVSEEWCKRFLEAARRDGRERSVKDSFRAQYGNLNRGKDKRFVCFRRILVIYEGRRPVDFHAIRDVTDQIVRKPDRLKGNKDSGIALFSIAVSIEMSSNARRQHRVPNYDLDKDQVTAP